MWTYASMFSSPTSRAGRFREDYADRGGSRTAGRESVDGGPASYVACGYRSGPASAVDAFQRHSRFLVALAFGLNRAHYQLFADLADRAAQRPGRITGPPPSTNLDSDASQAGDQQAGEHA